MLRQFTAGFIEGFVHEDTVRYSGYNEPLVILPPREFEVEGEDDGNVLLPEPTLAPVATPTPSPVPTAPLPTPSPTPIPAPTLTPTLAPTPTPTPRPTVAPTSMPTPTAVPIPPPSINLSPVQVSLGAQASVSGDGFDPGVLVTVRYGTFDVAFVRTDQSGAFVVDIIVPPLLVDPNINRITAISETGGSAWVDHFVANPTVVLSTSEAIIGAFIDVTGTGFDPESPASLVFGETLVAGQPLPYTDSHGQIDFHFQVPDLPSGPGEFRLTVAGDEATVRFEVLPPRLTLTRNTVKPNSIFVKGSGFFPGLPVTFSGAGSVFRNAKVADRNGEFEYEMLYTRDVRSEQITVTVETSRSTVSKVILAFNIES